MKPITDFPDIIYFSKCFLGYNWDVDWAPEGVDSAPDPQYPLAAAFRMLDRPKLESVKRELDIFLDQTIDDEALDKSFDDNGCTYLSDSTTQALLKYARDAIGKHLGVTP